MHQIVPFQALTVATLPLRLGDLAVMRERVGADAARWDVREVGDGNLNLVFVVRGDRGSVVVKQALPYFRQVGEQAKVLHDPRRDAARWSSCREV